MNAKIEFSLFIRSNLVVCLDGEALSLVNVKQVSSMNTINSLLSSFTLFNYFKSIEILLNAAHYTSSTGSIDGIIMKFPIGNQKSGRKLVGDGASFHPVAKKSMLITLIYRS